MYVIFLVAVYQSKRFLTRWFYHVHALNPKPDFIYFFSNNCPEDVEFIRQNCKIPFKIIQLWFVDNAVEKTKTRYDTIAIARQTLLDCARHHKPTPDYAIYFDDDCYLLDTDTIPKMLQWNEDIIGGTYERVYPEGVYIASKWGIMQNGNYELRVLKVDNGNGYCKKCGAKLIQKNSCSICHLKEVAKPFDCPMITSGGALALSKRVFMDRHLDFYPIGLEIASEDYGYCVKATKLGYKIILDNTARIHHYYNKTIEDIKPWTMIDNKYPEFLYGKYYAQHSSREVIKLHREIKKNKRKWKKMMKHKFKPINIQPFK